MVKLAVPGIAFLLSIGLATTHALEQMQMMRFDGTRWVPFGDIIDAGVGPR